MKPVEEPVFSKTPVEGWMFSIHVGGYISDEGAAMLLEAHIEQKDESFNSRHGTRHCRNMGCLGPMCAKAARDYVRNRRGRGSRINTRHKYGKFDSLLDHLQQQYDREWFGADKVLQA